MEDELAATAIKRAEEPLTIEELGDIFEKGGMCPFYDQKYRIKTADVIFMPYNYIIDQ